MAQKDQLMLMKSKDDEAEKTAFERIEYELKQMVFGVLYLMLQDDEVSFLRLLIFSVISELQFLSLIFSPVINYPWRSGIFTSYFKGFLQLFQLLYWATLLNWTAYLAFFYIAAGLVIIVVGYIVYAVYTFHQTKSTVMWPLHILRNVCSLFITVLFLPMTGTALSYRVL